MTDKKGNVLPPPTAAPGIAGGPPQANTGAPAPQPYGVLPGIPTAAPYMVPGQQLYAQGPPPTYDQALTHPAIVGQPYHQGCSHIPYTQASSTQDVTLGPAKAHMSYRYAQDYQPYYQWGTRENVYPPGAAMYAAGYPTYLGYPTYAPMQYYPSLGAYSYPMQHAQLRPTIMIPNSYDAGARFDGITQQVLPPAPPGVPPNAAQLAAMAGHQVALGQKKGSFLSGGSEGGYTFW